MLYACQLQTSQPFRRAFEDSIVVSSIQTDRNQSLAHFDETVFHPPLIEQFRIRKRGKETLVEHPPPEKSFWLVIHQERAAALVR